VPFANLCAEGNPQNCPRSLVCQPCLYGSQFLHQNCYWASPLVLLEPYPPNSGNSAFLDAIPYSCWHHQGGGGDDMMGWKVRFRIRRQTKLTRALLICGPAVVIWGLATITLWFAKVLFAICLVCYVLCWMGTMLSLTRN